MKKLLLGTTIFMIFLTSGVALSHEIKVGSQTISVLPTHKIFANHLDKAKDEENDTKLAEALQNILNAFKNNDVNLYMKNHISQKDFNQQQKNDPKFSSLIPKVLMKRKTNERCFHQIIKYMETNDIDIKNAKFIEIHREPIDHDRVHDSYVIRKVYLIFEISRNKKYRIYLKTMMTAQDGTWKMIKYSLMNKDIKSDSY